MPLYFAYGSNMDCAAMAARCPASRPLGLARLARHRLVIMKAGYASVARDPRGTVHGLLFDLALADVPALDRYEGVAGGLYVKAQRPVLTGAGPRRALVYLGRDSSPGVPRPGYLEAVLAAAGEIGLPAPYLAALAALAPRTARAPSAAPSFRSAFDRAIQPTRATPRDPDAGALARMRPWDP